MMFIAKAIDNILNGQTITYYEYLDEHTKSNTSVTKNIKFDYGDQDELNKWVAGRKNVEKYPLVWYVMDKAVKNINVDFYESKIKLIIFTSTKQQYYNRTRALINYNEILDPISEKIESILYQGGQIELSDININIYDVPNFGFTPDLGTTLDYLDAKVFEFKARVIKNKCFN